MMDRRIAAVACCGVLFVLGSLGRGADPKRQGTPKETVAKMQKALAGGDRQMYKECYESGKKQQDLAGAFYDAVQAATLLKNALIETRGPDAWEEYQALYIDFGDGRFRLTKIHPPPTDSASLDQCSFVEKGDEASFEGPQHMGGELKKSGGVWRISSDVFEGHEEVWTERFAKMATAMQERLAAARNPDSNMADLKRAILTAAYVYRAEGAASRASREPLTVAGIVKDLEGRRNWRSNTVKVWLRNPTVIVKSATEGGNVVVHAWGGNENDYNVPMMRVNDGDLLYEITNDEYQFLAGRSDKSALTQPAS